MIISEVGNVLLSFATAFSAVTTLSFFFKNYYSHSYIFGLSRFFTLTSFFIILFSFILLSYAFLTDNFSILYVANNSNITLPDIYKFSATWGAHEGSILLWVLILSFWTLLVAFFSDSLPKVISINMLSIMNFIILAFLTFIIFTSNPFDTIFPAPENGNDLNPLLQDPGLIIHPPLLYFGYVGTSIPFAFAVAILFNEEVKPKWISWLRKWVTLTWFFLTAGISLGSWWAYHELGWGGWWFWDPVENASFMPWLILTALIHSLIISEKRNIFLSWSIFLSILAFSLSLLGTFLVRSGILVSVHAFANDPERGIYILTFLSVIIGFSLILYMIKSNRLTDTNDFTFNSKEFVLLINNILLTIITFAILLGTLYPLIASTLDLGKISVGPPYFNYISTFLFLPMILLMSPAVFMAWKKNNLKKIIKPLTSMFILSLILAFIVTWLFYEIRYLIVLISLAFAIFAILSSIFKIYENIKIHSKIKSLYKRLININFSILSNSFAHIGIGVLVIGITISNYFSLEKEILMKPGDSTMISNVEIIFNGIKKEKEQNYSSKVGVFYSYKNDVYQLTYLPEKRIYNVQKNVMTEAAISSSLARDIYIALGEEVSSEQWSVRIYYKPLIQFIWLGVLFMLFSTFFVFFDKRKMLKK